MVNDVVREGVPTPATRYPKQFWLLLGGLLIEITGYSMVWPFLAIYLRQHLDVPLTTVSLLFAVSSATNLAATAVVGPVLDRFGRKRAMVLGLAAASLLRLTMSTATTLPLWTFLIALQGAFSPLYRVGVDSMVADLVEPDRRLGAYALLRTSFNVGIAIGPSIGGFVTATSYSYAFYIAAGSTAVFALLVLLFGTETLPRSTVESTQRRGGYGPVLRDRTFVAFCAMSTLALMPSTILMILLPVYAKENFGVPESQYGFIMATNAAMVVLFQYGVTRLTRRYPAPPVLVAGALLYGAGAGSVAFGWNFPTFLLSMVILTIGELLLAPTATMLTANLAPPDMRGRYMGLYNLTWGISSGVGPVIGGLLNDHVAPVAIWYGAAAFGLSAAVGYVGLRRKLQTSDVHN